jgi:hypothetical protein
MTKEARYLNVRGKGGNVHPTMATFESALEDDRPKNVKNQAGGQHGEFHVQSREAEGKISEEAYLCGDAPKAWHQYLVTVPDAVSRTVSTPLSHARTRVLH